MGLVNIYERSRNFTDLPNDFNVGSETVFEVTFQAYWVISRTVKDIINVTVFQDAAAYQRNQTNDAIQAVWQGMSNDTSAWTCNIALNMSNALRLTASAEQSVRSGAMACSTESFARVRWAWPTFPVATVVGSIIFLLGSIWQKAQLGYPPGREGCWSCYSSGYWRTCKRMRLRTSLAGRKG